jgi:hypothetical protein
MIKAFCIFSLTELNLINFNEVLETSINTVRKSLDGTKTFVKWYGDTPSCILQLTTIEGYYTYEEILEILATAEWNENFTQ